MLTNLNYNKSKSKYKSESLKNASQNNLKHVQNNLVNTKKIVLVSIPCLNNYSRKVFSNSCVVYCLQLCNKWYPGQINPKRRKQIYIVCASSNVIHSNNENSQQSHKGINHSTIH